jgi:hypothetical protein
MSIKIEMEEITPQTAMTWLSAVPEYQRKVDQKQVRKLVLAIRRNEWRENGATIVFNEVGDLLDGQHRLQAISIAGKTVRSLVVYDVPKGEDIFNTIGDEKPRKITDFMHVKNANVVAAALRTYWLILNGMWPPPNAGGGGIVVPHANLLKLIKKHADYVSSLVEPSKEAGRLTGQHSFCVFLIFYFARVQEGYMRKTGEFFGRLGDGVGLEATSLILKLRKIFLDASASRPIQRGVAKALVLKALNHYLNDEQIQGPLRFEIMREDFPPLIGYDKMNVPKDIVEVQSIGEEAESETQKDQAGEASDKRVPDTGRRRSGKADTGKGRRLRARA